VGEPHGPTPDCQPGTWIRRAVTGASVPISHARTGRKITSEMFSRMGMPQMRPSVRFRIGPHAGLLAGIPADPGCSTGTGFEILLGGSRGKYTNMDIDIIEEKSNPMLHRTDVRFEMTHEEATPSRLSVRDSLAAKLNKDAEEVVVHELDTKFGMRKTAGYAKVYDSPEFAQDVEQDHMLERNKIVADGDEAEEA